MVSAQKHHTDAHLPDGHFELQWELSAHEAHLVPEIKVEQGISFEPTALEAAAASTPIKRADSEAETVGVAVGHKGLPVDSPWPRAGLAWLGTLDRAERFRNQLPTIQICSLLIGKERSLRGKRRKNCFLAPRLLVAHWRDTGPNGRAGFLRRIELRIWEQLLRVVFGLKVGGFDPASRTPFSSQASAGRPRAIAALPTAPEFGIPSACMRLHACFAVAAPPRAPATRAPSMPRCCGRPAAKRRPHLGASYVISQRPGHGGCNLRCATLD